jgi:hypothetical protein
MTVKLVCCCCGKQAVWGREPSRDDKHVTKIEGGRAGFKSGEVFCGYCAEDMDENGLFPEEAAQVEDLRNE